MIIGQVIGSIVSTVKNRHFEGKKLMIIRPLKPNHSATGDPTFLAIDTVSAGVDDIVLINREGSGARLILENEDIPVQSVIVGVIDKIEDFND